MRGGTRLHSVPSAFQLVTAAVVFKNILKPTCRPTLALRLTDEAQVSQAEPLKAWRQARTFATLSTVWTKITALACFGLGKKLVNEPDANVVAPGRTNTRLTTEQ